jgi:hypothetical protein
MKIMQYLVSGTILAVGVAISCSPDPALYPLPYDSRSTGSYLRAYQIKSNTWDLDDMANSGFEAVYESVDANLGADLVEINFFATHRSGATGRITNEILVKTVDFASGGFAKVPEPTYSDYLRSAPIRITAAETLAALSTLTVDPDGTTCSGIFPDVCTMVAFPGTGLAVGDRIIFRISITDKAGRKFTVQNPQTTVTPALGNPNDANVTANLSGGLFYASPMIFTTMVQRTVNIGVIPVAANADAYTGTYLMKQVARWQPDHSAAQHLSFPQAWIDEFAFGDPATSSDSSQIVTLVKASTTGGLSTQRQFTCKYRGQDITMVINLEMAILNQTGAGIAGATLTTVQTAAPLGFGFPAGTTNANLGTVNVPLLNSGVNCTSEREFYFQFPLGGSCAGLNTLPFGLPRVTVPNRGFYRIDRDGLTPGDVFTIAVDDDGDEYGRRNGYCNWYTRIMLTLTKQ